MMTRRWFEITAALLLSAAMGMATGSSAQTLTAEIQPDAGPQETLLPDVTVLAPPAADLGEAQEAAQKVTMEIAARTLDVVKGKPYSADATTETVQMLADGNRIVHRTVGKFYRDNEGRTRREQTFGNVDPAHPSPHETKVFLDDPVGGSAFLLDPAAKSADKIFRSHTTLDGSNTPEDSGPIVIKSDTEPGGPGASARMLIKFRDEHSGSPNTAVSRIEGDKRDVVKEDLGSRNIEGVDCTGTRTTTTIPANAIGNEKPISIVSETWYAPTIAAVVESTTDDPRYGKTTYQLTNVQLSEPPHSLFEPAGDGKLSGPK